MEDSKAMAERPSYYPTTPYHNLLDGRMAKFALEDNDDLTALGTEELRMHVLQRYDQTRTVEDNELLRRLKRKVAASVLLLRKLESEDSSTIDSREFDSLKKDETAKANEDEINAADLAVQLKEDVKKLRKLKHTQQLAEIKRSQSENKRILDFAQNVTEQATYDNKCLWIGSDISRLQSKRLEGIGDLSRTLNRHKLNLDKVLDMIEQNDPQDAVSSATCYDRAVGDSVAGTYSVGVGYYDFEHSRSAADSTTDAAQLAAVDLSSTQTLDLGVPTTVQTVNHPASLESPLSPVKAAFADLKNGYGAPAVVGGAVLAGLSLSSLGALLWSLVASQSSHSLSSREHSRQWSLKEGNEYDSGDDDSDSDREG
jgi:hypothetical protein